MSDKPREAIRLYVESIHSLLAPLSEADRNEIMIELAIVEAKTLAEVSKQLDEAREQTEEFHHAGAVAGGSESRLHRRDRQGDHVTDEKSEKWRANYIPAPHFYNLNQAVALINRAFSGFGCYLVGSSRERRDYRDVDVRLILVDEDFDHLFRSTDGQGWVNLLWSLMCTSISLWLKQQTDLPVDFQIQRQTQANADHPGRRAALGIFLDYPGKRPSDIASSTDE